MHDRYYHRHAVYKLQSTVRKLLSGVTEVQLTMLRIGLDSKLAGVRGVSVRLAFAAVVALSLAITLRGTAVDAWLSALILTMLAFGAGVATLWSP